MEDLNVDLEYKKHDTKSAVDRSEHVRNHERGNNV